MVTTVSASLLVAGAMIGGGHPAARSECCDSCGIVKSEVLDLIVRLQSCPNWKARDRAAKQLRRYDWTCHPEVANALVTALLSDCEEEVREESAESLAKLAPCLPEVHAALDRAASCDPDHSTRKWARRALKALRKRCDGECTICEPGLTADGPPGVPVAPEVMPRTIEVDPVPVVVPPSEVLPPPAEGSPFLPPSATRDRRRLAAESAAGSRKVQTRRLPRIVSR